MLYQSVIDALKEDLNFLITLKNTDILNGLGNYEHNRGKRSAFIEILNIVEEHDRFLKENQDEEVVFPIVAAVKDNSSININV